MTWITLLAALAPTLVSAPAQEAAASEDARPYLAAALAASRWLEASAIETEHGLTWPVEPAQSAQDAQDAANLYSGSPGVVLFFLELHAATGDARHLELARRGAEHLAADALADQDAGLYTGVAGIGFVLAEAARATGAEPLRAAALRCVQRLHDTAVATEHGVTWTDTTDVISGAAGTGLFLLYSAERFGRPQDRALAERAGRHLIATATKTEAGLSWPMDPSFARRMPNFSHGTAGVAYLLATLASSASSSGATGGLDFAEAARAGAAHLRSIADTTSAGLRIHHHTPGGEQLFYLGWCHGPVGTSRLFQRLDLVSDEEGWGDLVRDCVRALKTSGIPAQRTDGFWNNVGQCCGSAGVAELLLDAGELELAKRMADDVLARGTRADGSLFWIQAEHRSQPELLQAQTGYMQGAAGVGMMLLHLDAAEHGPRPRIRLPDDPY